MRKNNRSEEGRQQLLFQDMKCRVDGRDFSNYCHIHYDDVTGEAKPEYFWFPLGFSHD